MKRTLFVAWISAVALTLWPVAPPAAAPRCYPASRFVVLDGGLVRDTLTNLVWQQQASTTTITWADAKTYCANAGSGFRLPTVKELVSIVDLTVTLTSGAMINQTAFPNTPVDTFWTSSPLAGSSDSAWGVYFYNGFLLDDDVGSFLRVRCVR